jgi:hypothetical protein
VVEGGGEGKGKGNGTADSPFEIRSLNRGFVHRSGRSEAVESGQMQKQPKPPVLVDRSEAAALLGMPLGQFDWAASKAGFPNCASKHPDPQGTRRLRRLWAVDHLLAWLWWGLRGDSLGQPARCRVPLRSGVPLRAARG